MIDSFGIANEESLIPRLKTVVVEDKIRTRP